jgi:hypothetical protein
MITKEGYKKIALAIRSVEIMTTGATEYISKKELIKNLVLVLSLDNPRFRAGAFIKECEE